MLRNLKSFNLPEIEEKALSFWKEKGIFEKTLKQNRKGSNGKTFNFWEGPPSANGRPGIHHVLSRVMKDVFLRFRTMQGYRVPRQAGWDTHGLPIEIETEKTLGFKTKQDIEKFGIKEFNQKALEVVWRYKDEWEKITERIGFWLDMKHPYITCDPLFMESLWWVFKQLDGKGYLKEFYRVGPYCPRCQTALASHELGQPGVYRTVPDPSVYALFKISERKNEYLLVWTTTPWTLSANVAVAVSPKLVYTNFMIDGISVWAYRIPEEVSKGKTVTEGKKLSGKELIGWGYEPLYDLRKHHAKLSIPTEPYTVLPADFVSTEEGTGLVHIAPSFGEDDFNLISSAAKKGDSAPLVLPQTVNSDGSVAKGFPGEGLFVKKADAVILEDLEKRHLLLRAGTVEHEYPFCWRCGTPLLYMARRSWFFEVSKIRKQLVEANSSVHWVPEYIKEGRFGEWIAQARDWALSRERFWGTPLPIWRCDTCGETEVVGSLAELGKKSDRKNSYFIMRHGQARANVEAWIAGGTESGKFISKLTQNGAAQAERTAKKLQKEKIDLIIASPYHRTKETAHIVQKATGVKLIFDDRLREIDTGVFNHKKITDYKLFFKNKLDRFTVAPEKGETLDAVRRRVYGFLQDIDATYEGKKILIVSHGDPLWMLEAAVRHMKNEDVLKDASLYMKMGESRRLPYERIPTDELGFIDLHRPYSDAITFACAKCAGEMKRVPEVADVWFDSGAMPYGSTHFPFASKSKSGKPERFPADFISEGIDQTRGWFYTLMTTAVLLGYGTPYRNVVSLGLVLDKNGQKMSKSKGNVVDPWALIQKYGIDAIRWYFYTVNDPGEPKNFDEEDVLKALRRLPLVAYNSFSFLQMYGKKKLPLNAAPESPHVLDQWIMERLDSTVRIVSQRMEEYSVLPAAQAIETFTDDLSRWYIRRSRRRLQKNEDKKDWERASATLAYILLQYSKLIAPFTPFFAEALYQSSRKEYAYAGTESVHLELFPSAPKGKKDELSAAMQWARDIASKALAKRAELQIKVRQPLVKLTVQKLPKAKQLNAILEVVRDEVNVKRIEEDASLQEEFILDTEITPELKTEGMLREFVRIVQDLRQEAGYVPKDRIELWISSESVEQLVRTHADMLMKEIGAKKISVGRTEKADAQTETKLNEYKAWIGVRKTT